MRTLTYYVATTLDGFIAGSDGADPTSTIFTVGPDSVEYIVTHYPETLPGPVREAMGVTSLGNRFDTVLEGRRSYQLGLDAGMTNAYPHLRHIVFSRSLGQSPDPTVELVSDDPAETARRLKAGEGGGIWLVGGAELAGALYEEIDELILKVSPVAIGAGIPLFGGGAGGAGRGTGSAPRRFVLTENRILPSGVAFLTYARQTQ
jgi:dihydrofolate reductase